MITTFDPFKGFIKAQNILLVGGGPDADKVSGAYYEDYDRIIRLNNFKYANDSKRTDIWYSYFGRNIKEVEYRLKNENIKMVACKYPINMEFAWAYELRKLLWEELPTQICIPTEKESFQTNNPFGISPTVGFCAIFDILRAKPGKFTIIGFDFFESGIHDYDEEWDQSGGHIPSFERRIVEVLAAEEKLTWLK